MKHVHIPVSKDPGGERSMGEARCVPSGCFDKGHPEDINMDQVLQNLTKADELRVLSGLGFETPVNENCGCVTNIV